VRRFVALAALLAAVLAAPWTARGAAPVPGRSSPLAAELVARADEDFSALRASASAQRQRQNYVRVLEAYRRVFEKYPGTLQSEQALLRAGELLTLLYRWTGQAADLNRAQNYYQRLVQTAPRSPLADDALLAIAYLHLDHYQDPAQAWLRFRDVTLRTPDGDKAPEAKRQLKRLARYAPREAPALVASGDADLSCPAPGGTPGASAPIASTPPTAAQPETIPTSSTGPEPPQPPLQPAAATSLNRIRGIRHWSNPEYSRVVIDLDQKTNFYSNLLEDRSGAGKPPRLYVDLFGSLVEERFCKPISVNDGILLGIRAGQYTPDSVRVVLEIDRLSTYRVFPMQNPFRIVVDVTGGAPPSPPAIVADSLPVAQGTAAPPPAEGQPGAGRTPGGATSITAGPEPVPALLPLPPLSFAPAPAPASGLDAAPSTPPAPAAKPPEREGKAKKPPVAAEIPPAADTSPPAGTPAPRGGAVTRAATPVKPAGKLSLARQLGLGVRRVVIDAGHGAQDPGAIGIGGLQEKDVTLDLALRVRDILQAAGYATVLTRDRDVYLPLEERTALANTARGDLFLSLHCNSSDDGNLSGVETYYLNLASSRRAIATAARENSMALANMSDLQDLLKEIYNSKMDESSQFAAAVQRSLHASLRRSYADVKDLGVKQAPFYVLIGAQMPSVLAEVSFINHRAEGRRLADPAYRQLIAQAIADGVKRYVKTFKTAALPGSGRPTP
jgi:N-acetylmuramoyl-L-alanine amidase